MKKVTTIGSIFLIFVFGYLFHRTYMVNASRELLWIFGSCFLLGFVIKDFWIRAFFWSCLVSVASFNKMPIYMLEVYLSFVKVALACGVIVALQHYIKTERDVRIIMNFICVAVMIQVIYAYLQRMGFDPVYSSNGAPEVVNAAKKQVIGFCHAVNHFAAFIGIGFCCFFRNTWKFKGVLNINGKMRKITVPVGWWMCIPVILPVLFLNNNTTNNTRGGILLIGFTFLYFATRKLKSIDRLTIYVWGALLGAVLLLKMGGSSGRFEVWVDTLKNMAPERYLLGYGLGKYRVWLPAGSFWTAAHNEYIQTFFVVGIFGLLSILGYINKIIRDFLLKKRDYYQDILLCGVFCVGINCMVNFTFHRICLMILCLTFIGVYGGYKGKVVKDERKKVRKTKKVSTMRKVLLFVRSSKAMWAKI